MPAFEILRKDSTHEGDAGLFTSGGHEYAKDALSATKNRVAEYPEVYRPGHLVIAVSADAGTTAQLFRIEALPPQPARITVVPA